MNYINIALKTLIVAVVSATTMIQESQATIVVTLFSGSNYNSNVALMNANLGITGLQIEDFEDTTLINGLSYTLTNPSSGTFTSLPNVFDTTLDPAWVNGSWDGQRVLVNNTNNLYPNEGTRTNGLTFNVAGGTRTFGVGLSNFQSLSSSNDQFPINDHTLLINGISFSLLEALNNWTPGRTVRNGYLLIQASGADIINNVGFVNVGNGGDVMLFDHVAVQAVPEPATMSLIGLGLAGLVARRKSKKA